MSQVNDILISSNEFILNNIFETNFRTLLKNVNTKGKMGYFQNTFSVYGKENKSCINRGCSSKIKKVFQSNRSTFLCPTCQKNSLK